MSRFTLEEAAEVVGQMFTQANGREITPVEGSMWAAEIARVGPDRLMAFARFWMAGGGQSGSSGALFLRPPRLDDFWRFADPNYMDEAIAVEVLRGLVKTVGPYANPNIQDARLRGAVHALGGWAKVNQIMPDPVNEFAVKRFMDTFRLAWNQSVGQEMRGEIAPPSLKSLAEQPDQLRIAQQPVESLEAQEQEGFAP